MLPLCLKEGVSEPPCGCHEGNVRNAFTPLLYMPDKLNHVDYRWYIVRTRPRQERKLAELLEQYKAKSVNILEVYTPTHTTVNIRHEGSERQAPLFVGTVFVLATQKALTDFMEEHSLNGILQYERKNGKGEKTRLRVIPEEQMRAFRDYNENYADRVIVLERPYTDYAFNAKSDEPNEIVRVIDGPLAGRKGYICRFRRDKRLVFRVCGMDPGSYLTVSYPSAPAQRRRRPLVRRHRKRTCRRPAHRHPASLQIQRTNTSDALRDNRPAERQAFIGRPLPRPLQERRYSLEPAPDTNERQGGGTYP